VNLVKFIDVMNCIYESSFINEMARFDNYEKGKSMKPLRKIFLFLVLSLNPIQLWAVEDEEPKNLQEMILSLYKSAIEIHEKVLNQGFEQMRDRPEFFNKEFFDSIFQEISDPVVNDSIKSLSKISDDLIDILQSVEILEFEEFFKDELAVKHANFWDSFSDLSLWYERARPVFSSACLGNQSIRKELQFKLLFVDCFSPSFWSLDKNGKELCYLKVLDANGEERFQLPNPYYWLMDEMIQFLLKKESMETEESLHILKCVDILLRKSRLIPFANRALVKAFYCDIWIRQTLLELEKLERLESIFNQSKNAWTKIWFMRAYSRNE